MDGTGGLNGMASKNETGGIEELKEMTRTNELSETDERNRINVMNFGIETSLSQHHYTCEKTLGQGGFSQVYRVRQQATGAVFACKISRRDKLLKQEADWMQQLTHPLFPKFIEYWQENGWQYLVMEEVRGSSLKELINRRGPFTRRAAIEIARELAICLKYLHEQPIPLLYRDLKPDHVYIQQDGRVKLIDLGCICPLGDGSLAGTPGYGAPEQLVMGEAQGFYSDVYGWGRVLTYLLTGHTGVAPEQRKDALYELCARATTRQIAQRLPDMRAVLKELEQSDGHTRGWSRRKPQYEYIKNIWKKSTLAIVDI